MNNIKLKLVANNQSLDNPAQMDIAQQRLYIEKLFRSHQSSLQRYLTRLLQNDDDAEEMMQETYIRALQHGGIQQIDDRAKALLYKIATNLVIDKSRKDQRNHTHQHSDLELESVEDITKNPVRGAEDQQTMERLQAVLKDLPERTREVFILNRFSGLTYPQIAEKMSITTRTVERQMALAVALCREKLRDLL